MNLLQGVSAVLGVALVLTVLVDAFQVMLLPRRVRWRLRPVRAYINHSWRVWRLGARLLPASQTTGFLSLYGPLSLLALFALWSLGLIGGFALLHWAIQPDPTVRLRDLAYFSGVTFFTLGYGDITPETSIGRLLAVTEAGLGFAFIAVVIGYLPTLYQLYSTREAHVLRLDARAGSPPTATELLLRHAAYDAGEDLRLLLRDWESWSAQLLESHVSYPMLSYYRSQQDNLSWLAALAAVMDTSAFVLVSLGGPSKLQARMTYTGGRLVLLELASILEARDPTPGDERLTPQALAALRDGLEGHGLELSRGPDADAELSELRAAYEPLLLRLSVHLRQPLPGWAPPADAEDNWEQDLAGHRAKAVVEQVVEDDERRAASGPSGAP